MAHRGSDIVRVWLPVLLWIGVIALESFALPGTVTGGWLRWAFRQLHIHMSPAAFEHLHHLLRKAGHFAGYGILCVLLLRAWYEMFSASAARKTRAVMAALGCTLLIAVLDEWHQSFNALRTGTPRDVVLDMCGAVFFLLLAWVFYLIGRRGTRPATA